METAKFAITYLDKAEQEAMLPQLFDVLCDNMSEIAPTGNTRAQDFAIWMSNIIPQLEKDERRILLIKSDNRLVGYFQYSVKDATLFMEEIQFSRAYWGSGAFAALYRFLAAALPPDVSLVRANASKQNRKSQAILEHLGLAKTGENKTGKSFCYAGNCQKMLEPYKNRSYRVR